MPPYITPGTLDTVYKVLDTTVDPVGLFQCLRRGPHAFLLESADLIEKYGDKSTGCVDPSLRITAKNGRFAVRALNARGRRYLAHLGGAFPFAVEVAVSDEAITGRVPVAAGFQDEDARLKSGDIFDVLRAVVFRLEPRIRLDIPFGGLYGVIAYDAVRAFETLPPQPDGGLPDLDFYFADNLFVMDHLQNKTYLISNLPVLNGADSDARYDCMETIRRLEEAVRTAKPYHCPPAPAAGPPAVAVSDTDYRERVAWIQEHIGRGDIFQCVLSRSFRVPAAEPPLQVYARLKAINPGPYMFYFQAPEYALLGSSPETCLKVSAGPERTVEIRPIAGTFPRGRRGDRIDPELDSRFELDLLQDGKELAEHCMLVDLARNDIARVAAPGTRHTPELLKVEKYSHVQHLVSTVRGRLRADLDALHAYKATMNMGTLTGAPKIKAMELICRYEPDARGFYGGAVCYLTPRGDFDSCIVIRSILLRDGMAEVRAGAGIVYDSVPERECEETWRKSRACLEALGVMS
ncbi:MAG TPA: anthranilate synthase component 1 [Acidobacteriota bacterium]|nr:anthranilate synthase component 1 [Acidobacteriota bacterium]HNT99691.1 anthranilate synthase component 1 [Acidobacteriota bacterium]HPB29153.1 anthranilate synthase component 1 [Acidobacteriota bacterium]